MKYGRSHVVDQLRSMSDGEQLILKDVVCYIKPTVNGLTNGGNDVEWG